MLSGNGGAAPTPWNFKLQGGLSASSQALCGRTLQLLPVRWCRPTAPVGPPASLCPHTYTVQATLTFLKSFSLPRSKGGIPTAVGCLTVHFIRSFPQNVKASVPLRNSFQKVINISHVAAWMQSIICLPPLEHKCKYQGLIIKS